MNQHLVIEIKNVYGSEVAYPINEAAQLFARIAGTKTLKTETLHYAKRLGYTIGFAIAGREVVPA